MSGLLSGLSGLGLDNLENMEIYEVPKNNASEDKPMVPKVDEKDLIYDKMFTCPVCGKNFSSKIMKTGKAKLIGTDPDLRPKYEGIDAVKYDVWMCPYCGYAALSRFFPNISSGQAKLVLENISSKVQLHHYEDEIYSYEEAIERYTLTLANAVVKRARASEKAYICLKSAWLLRGYGEYLQETGDGKQDSSDVKQKEEEYLLNAYSGFLEAVKTEGFPMCGMDEHTINFLLAQMAFHLKKMDVAGRMVSAILASASASARMKDKARDLKDQILAELKRK